MSEVKSALNSKDLQRKSDLKGESSRECLIVGERTEKNESNKKKRKFISKSGGKSTGPERKCWHCKKK